MKVVFSVAGDSPVVALPFSMASRYLEKIRLFKPSSMTMFDMDFASLKVDITEKYLEI